MLFQDMQAAKQDDLANANVADALLATKRRCHHRMKEMAASWSIPSQLQAQTTLARIVQARCVECGARGRLTLRPLSTIEDKMHSQKMITGRDVLPGAFRQWPEPLLMLDETQSQESREMPVASTGWLKDLWCCLACSSQ